MTRQLLRAMSRASQFILVNQRYGMEPRRARRRIARIWASREWKQLRLQVNPQIGQQVQLLARPTLADIAAVTASKVE